MHETVQNVRTARVHNVHRYICRRDLWRDCYFWDNMLDLLRNSAVIILRTLCRDEHGA